MSGSQKVNNESDGWKENEDEQNGEMTSTPARTLSITIPVSFGCTSTVDCRRYQVPFHFARPAETNLSDSHHC
jgi:hypothetical protein